MNVLDHFPISALEKAILEKRKKQNNQKKVRCKDCIYFVNLKYRDRFASNKSICKLRREEAKSKKDGVWKYCPQYKENTDKENISKVQDTIGNIIRNQLTPIVNLVQLLERENFDSAEIKLLKEHAKIAKNSVNKILNEIKDL